ncbi:MAG: TetR/AcrR family transcriptional regulator [Gammaproteobacteria bacterium]
MPRPSRREHLIKTAMELFAEHGYHATGVDLIMATAGVSKKTLYTYFRSKDELILACLENYADKFRDNFMAQVEQAAETPRDRLLAIFDIAETWFCQADFYGCVFINACGEFSEKDSRIREVSREFKRLLLSYFEHLCRQLPVSDPDELARELALLQEGAIVTAQVSGNSASARTARRAAVTLLEAAIA